MKRIIIIEDQTIVLESLARTIEIETDFKVVATSTCANDAFELVKNYEPDLLIMDIFTENRSNGLSVAVELKKIHPMLKIIIMTSITDPTYLKTAKEANIDSFIYKNIGTKDFVTVVKNTLSEYTTYPRSSHNLEFGDYVFDDDEYEILRKICIGKSRKEISEDLHLSESTVKKQISKILDKTDFNNVSKLAIYLLTNKLISIVDIEEEYGQD